jgi:hypothetical protein
VGIGGSFLVSAEGQHLHCDYRRTRWRKVGFRLVSTLFRNPGDKNCPKPSKLALSMLRGHFYFGSGFAHAHGITLFSVTKY